MEGIGRFLLFVGGGLFLAGLVIIAVDRIPGVGHLPRDIVVHRGNFTFYFPVVTMLLASLVLTIVINLLMRLFK